MSKRIQFDLLELFELKTMAETELLRTKRLLEFPKNSDSIKKIYNEEIKRYENIVKKVQRAIDSYFDFAK